MRYAMMAMLLGSLCATSGAIAAGPMKVALIDVEGGGATLLVTPEGRSVLLDTGWPAAPGGGPGDRPSPGSSADRIAAAARGLGLKKIDYLIVTHYHLDHVGGVPDLLAKFPVGTIIDHGANRETAPTGAGVVPVGTNHPSRLDVRYRAALAGRAHRIVKAGDRLNVGSMTLDFVTADGVATKKPLVAGAGATPGCDAMEVAPAVPTDENARSIGVVVSFGKARVLSMGDATMAVEKPLVCPVNRIGPIDLLVVSHHGSGSSSSPQLIAATAPRVALMGNGARKGGDARVFETLAAAPSKPVLWQQHAATRSPTLDRPADYVANLDGQADAGHMLTAEIWADGAIRVTNGRNGFQERYPAR